MSKTTYKKNQIRKLFLWKIYFTFYLQHEKLVHLKVMWLDRHAVFVLLHSYADFRLIDIKKLIKSIPLTMESLIKLMKESCDSATSALNQKWISECCAIINDNRERIEDWMPHDTVSYFNNSHSVCTYRQNCHIYSAQEYTIGLTFHLEL